MTRFREGQAASLAEIRAAGLAALARELGPVGFVRFLQQFESGRGDYTAERHGWLDPVDVATLAADVPPDEPAR